MKYQEELQEIKQQETRLQERRKNLIARQIWDLFSEELSTYDREARIIFCEGVSENVAELTEEMVDMLRLILGDE